MEQATHNKIVSFIWGIADDVLRHFNQPQPLCTLEEISAAILAAEREAEGLRDDSPKTGRP
jgi:hypothetical protein